MYEFRQVKQGISYVSRNKEYGPISPYLSAGIDLCVTFIEFDIQSNMLLEIRLLILQIVYGHLFWDGLIL